MTPSANALYLAYRDPRTPWYARLLTACVLSYACSPIRLIPHILPLLSYLDELLLVSFGLALTRRLIPPDVLAESRAKAGMVVERPTGWDAAVLVVAAWMLVAVGMLLAGLQVLATMTG
jgi:uncharacterized membrane protein YkvA (DUF1232 family)